MDIRKQFRHQISQKAVRINNSERYTGSSSGETALCRFHKLFVSQVLVLKDEGIFLLLGQQLEGEGQGKETSLRRDNYFGTR